MRSNTHEAAFPKYQKSEQCDGFFKKNQTQITIILITLIPTIILICSTFISLWFVQSISLKMIEDFAEELYKDQIDNSKQQNNALVFQLNQQVQKIAWQMNMLNEFLGSVLLGIVIKNQDHIPAIHNIDRSYYNDENPQVLSMFKRNPVLTSVWQLKKLHKFQSPKGGDIFIVQIYILPDIGHHVNKSKLNELDERQWQQLDDGQRMDSIWKAIKFDNKIKNQRFLKIKDIFMAHEYDGFIYMTSINTTYTTYPIPKGCSYVGKYRLDLRCRYYYPPTMANISTMLYDPQIFYTEGNPHLASAFCQRRLKYKYKDPDSESEKYSILCITLDLSIIPQYFQNFGNNSKYQLFLDPRKLTVVYHSLIPLQRAKIATVQEFETNSLQNQDEANKFLENISAMSQYILESKDKVDNVAANKNATQRTFEYNRNGTVCFVIENLITMIDKVPKYERLKSKDPAKKYQVKNAFLFLDVLSKEKMMQYSSDLQKMIKSQNIYFTYTSWGVIFLILGFELYYSIQLGKHLLHPVIHLTNILKQISVSNQSQDYPGNQKESASYTDQFYQMNFRNNEVSIFSEVQTEQDNQIQIDEHLDADSEGVCFSSDTQILLNSFQNLFKILRFTTQNLYKENESISLLNLNIQIQYFQQFGNYRALGVCHNNMGVIHYNCRRYLEALEHFQKAIIYARYELNVYSHKNEGLDLQNNINRCTINLRSTLFRNYSQQESTLLGQTAGVQDRQKNKSNFNNQQNNNQNDQGNQNLQGPSNSEREQHYWNLFNRNENFIKAFASYLNENNCLLWDIFEDYALENTSISQLYLPPSNKREMLNYYVILMGYFNSNLSSEAGHILNKFSSLYIKNYEIKNSPRSGQQNMEKSIANSYYLAKMQGQSPSYGSMQESQLLTQMGASSYNSDVFNSTLLLTPLQKIRNQHKKKLTFKGVKKVLDRSLEDKTSFLKKKLQYQYKNQIDSGRQESPQSSQQQIIFSQQYQPNNKMGILYEVINSNSSRKTYKKISEIHNSLIKNNSVQHPNSQNENQNIKQIIENFEQDSQIFQNCKLNSPEVIKTSLRKTNNKGLQTNKQEEQFVKSADQNQYLQNYIQSCKIMEEKGDQNFEQNTIFNQNLLFHENQYSDSGAQIPQIQIVSEIKQKRRTQDSTKKEIVSPPPSARQSRVTIKRLTTKNDSINLQQNIYNPQNKNLNESILITKNSLKTASVNTLDFQHNKPNKPEKRKLSHQRKFSNQVREPKISQSTVLNSRNQSMDNSKNNSKRISKKVTSCSTKATKEYYQHPQKRKKQLIYYRVRKIEKSEKLSHYEFSSDIYFYYYALQQAQFQIQQQNFLNAAQLLTNIQEQCVYYLPHLKKQALQRISQILQTQNIYSAELEEMKSKYTQLTYCNFHACVISACTSNYNQKKVYAISNDLVNEILFKEQDSFGLIKYSFDEHIYLQSMGLTTIKTINSDRMFFEQILESIYHQTNHKEEKQTNKKQAKQTSPLKQNNLTQLTTINKQVALHQFQDKDQSQFKQKLIQNTSPVRESQVVRDYHKQKDLSMIEVYSPVNSHTNFKNFSDNNFDQKDEKKLPCSHKNSNSLTQIKREAINVLLPVTIKSQINGNINENNQKNVSISHQKKHEGKLQIIKKDLTLESSFSLDSAFETERLEQKNKLLNQLHQNSTLNEQSNQQLFIAESQNQFQKINLNKNKQNSLAHSKYTESTNQLMLNQNQINRFNEQQFPSSIQKYTFNAKMIPQNRDSSNKHQIENEIDDQYSRKMNVIKEDQQDQQIKQISVLQSTRRKYSWNINIGEQSNCNSSSQIFSKQQKIMDNIQDSPPFNFKEMKQNLADSFFLQEQSPYLEQYKSSSQNQSSQSNNNQQVLSLQTDTSYMMLNSKKSLQNNKPLGDNNLENLDSSLLNLQISLTPILKSQNSPSPQRKRLDSLFTPKYIKDTSSTLQQSPKDDSKFQQLNLNQIDSFSFLQNENQINNGNQSNLPIKNNSSIVNGNILKSESNKSQIQDFYNLSNINNDKQQQNSLVFEKYQSLSKDKYSVSLLNPIQKQISNPKNNAKSINQLFKSIQEPNQIFDKEKQQNYSSRFGKADIQNDQIADDDNNNNNNNNNNNRSRKESINISNQHSPITLQQVQQQVINTADQTIDKTTIIPQINRSITLNNIKDNKLFNSHTHSINSLSQKQSVNEKDSYFNPFLNQISQQKDHLNQNNTNTNENIFQLSHQTANNLNNIPSSPMFLTPHHSQLEFPQLDLAPPSNLTKEISSPVKTKTEEIKEKKYIDSFGSTSEQVFHQGVQAALKYFILNTDQKITCYLSQKNYNDANSSNKQKSLLKQNQTYLIYITDQSLKLNNKLLLNELCQLLTNLDIELLVLVLNQSHSLEEYSHLHNIFLNEKSVISFFNNEQKLLQYIYNNREHVKNYLIPMILEHF